ncbi:type II toxin-antitoxin system Phd/YefM family antitoxin [Companilactobacillus muriivasis]|uniref:type II toxin-antitoxin system Phd/YefM family antitoxin n=1 Tax=Companilactobacillus muriivasis TaxID=3081444 RepID=UPI0030C73756
MATRAVDISEIGKNIKQWTDDIIDYDDYVIITKPHNRNVVMMSENEFDSWKETLYLLSTEANRKALDESAQQVKDIKLMSKEEWGPDTNK